MSDLSGSQQALLDFLRQYIDDNGFPPSYREMAAALDFRSTNGVAYQLRCLEDKGYLQRKTVGAPARAIRLTPKASPVPVVDVVQIPVLGRVAAGLPALSDELPDETISLDSSLCPGQDVFALRVSGDSMIEAGIFEGDLVFVQRRAEARAGDVVVAIVDGETTVKTFRRRQGMVVLEPANQAMEPIFIAPSSEIAVAGVVVGLYRQLA